MSTPLVDPQLAAFWNSDPSRLRPTPIVTTTKPDEHHVEKVAAELLLAFLLLHKLMKHELLQHDPALDPYRTLKFAYNKVSPTWLKVAIPAIQQAYALGSTAGITDDEREYLARTYASQLGDYLNASSADAVVDGFRDQLGARWSSDVAWRRAATAWGLDRVQMRAYVRSILNPAEPTQHFDLIPTAAKVFVDKALFVRGQRVGNHEAWQAMQMGQALSWLIMQRDGRLPADAQKEWDTAEDERVCPQCGPLDKTRINLDERFQTTDGNTFWAPGVHPACRCHIKLIYPEISNDVMSAVDDFWPKSDTPVERVQKQYNPQEPRDHGKWAKQNVPTVKVRERTMDARTKMLLDALTQHAEQQDQVIESTTPTEVANPLKPPTSVSNPLHGPAMKLNPMIVQSNPVVAPVEANPLLAPVANPLTNDTTAQQLADLLRPKPIHLGDITPPKPAPTPPPKPEEKPKPKPQLGPLYLFLGEHMHNLVSSTTQRDADMIPLYAGQSINFNYSFPDQVSYGKPWDHNTIDGLWAEAATKYGDEQRWAMPQVQRILYDRQRLRPDFEDDIFNPDTHEKIVRKMSDNEIQEVLDKAGYDHDDEDHVMMRDRVRFCTPESAVGQAWADWLEPQDPEHFDMPAHDENGALTPWCNLHMISRQLDEMQLYPHVSKVFVVDHPHHDSMPLEDGKGTTAMGGGYTVRGYRYYSAAHNGALPSGVWGIELVHLEPNDRHRTDSGWHPIRDAVDDWNTDNDFIDDRYLDDQYSYGYDDDDED